MASPPMIGLSKRGEPYMRDSNSPTRTPDMDIFLGKPLCHLDVDEIENFDVPRTSSVKPWEEIVVDNRGRRRFHGAFTGGFSAGYFNTVGSAKGWEPRSFSSSRDRRATQSQQKIWDFMDEEDVRLENESAGPISVDANYLHGVVAGAGKKSIKKSPEECIVPDTDGHRRAGGEGDQRSCPGMYPVNVAAAMASIFSNENSNSTGKRLLRKMGLREGMALGSHHRFNKIAATSAKNMSGVGEANAPLWTFSEEKALCSASKTQDGRKVIGPTLPAHIEELRQQEKKRSEFRSDWLSLSDWKREMQAEEELEQIDRLVEEEAAEYLQSLFIAKKDLHCLGYRPGPSLGDLLNVDSRSSECAGQASTMDHRVDRQNKEGAINRHVTLALHDNQGHRKPFLASYGEFGIGVFEEADKWENVYDENDLYNFTVVESVGEEEKCIGKSLTVEDDPIENLNDGDTTFRTGGDQKVRATSMRGSESILLAFAKETHVLKSLPRPRSTLYIPSSFTGRLIPRDAGGLAPVLGRAQLMTHIRKRTAVSSLAAHLNLIENEGAEVDTHPIPGNIPAKTRKKMVESTIADQHNNASGPEMLPGNRETMAGPTLEMEKQCLGNMFSGRSFVPSSTGGLGEEEKGPGGLKPGGFDRIPYHEILDPHPEELQDQERTNRLERRPDNLRVSEKHWSPDSSLCLRWGLPEPLWEQSVHGAKQEKPVRPFSNAISSSATSERYSIEKHIPEHTRPFRVRWDQKPGTTLRPAIAELSKGVPMNRHSLQLFKEVFGKESSDEE